MARIPKQSDIRVRTNLVEKQLIEERAEEFEMTISDYVRYCCLLNPPPNPLKKGSDKKEK